MAREAVHDVLSNENSYIPFLKYAYALIKRLKENIGIKILIWLCLGNVTIEYFLFLLYTFVVF